MLMLLLIEMDLCVTVRARLLVGAGLRVVLVVCWCSWAEIKSLSKNSLSQGDHRDSDDRNTYSSLLTFAVENFSRKRYIFIRLNLKVHGELMI